MEPAKMDHKTEETDKASPATDKYPSRPETIPRDYLVPREQLARLLTVILGDNGPYCMDPVGTIDAVNAAIDSLEEGKDGLVKGLRRRSMDAGNARDSSSSRREVLRAKAQAYDHAADLAEAEL